MYCDLWTIGTWGHPSPPKTCWRLKWMVPFDILASLNSVFKFKFKFFPQTAKHHIRVIKTFSITFLNKKIAHYRVWNHNAGISGDFKTTLFPFDILASLNSGEPSPCTMSSSRKNNIQRWKLDWEIHSSKHFSKPTSLRAESSISNPTEKSNYHNLFNHIRRWNIWSETKVWSKEVKPLEVLKFRYFWEGHRFGPSSTYNLTLLSNVKKRVEDWPNFYGLLKISELYTSKSLQ